MAQASSSDTLQFPDLFGHLGRRCEVMLVGADSMKIRRGDCLQEILTKARSLPPTEHLQQKQQSKNLEMLKRADETDFDDNSSSRTTQH